jgi:hypothetical protein
MKAKAADYGVSLSRLVLVAVEAYSRTYDDWPQECQPVAVSYGVWSMVDDKLQGVEDALRNVARQLGGVRRALRGVDDGEITLAVVTSCQTDLARMLSDVERCTQVLDHVCDAVHLVDPYLGPMADDSAPDREPEDGE